jgi:TonB family protein
MTALRLPILVSMGLHGMIAVVLALVPLGVKAVFEQRQEITVALIEPMPSPPVLEPIESSVTPELPAPVVHKLVRREQPPPQRIRTPRQVNASHAGVPAAAAPVSSPSESSMRAIPAFIVMPRSSNGAVLPAVLSVRDSLNLPTDMISSVSAVPNTGMVPPFNRPVPITGAEPRAVFRDASAERVEAARLKARPGQNLRPEYPRTAREAGWEGTVMLQVEILPDGKAGVVSVHRTSGHAILDDAALTAVQRWRFSPAMDGNFPIKTVVHLPVKFDLRTP